MILNYNLILQSAVGIGTLLCAIMIWYCRYYHIDLLLVFHKSVMNLEKKIVKSTTYSSGVIKQTNQSRVPVRNQNISPAVVEQRIVEVRNERPISPAVSYRPTESVAQNSKTTNLPNGDVYEGEMNENGDFHGYGKYLMTSQKMEYQGQFQNGRQSGMGKLYKVSPYSMPNNKSIVYEGMWKNGKKHGRGKYFYDTSDQHYYDGEWENDQRHGITGTYVEPNGTYIGKWRNGKMHGKGKLAVNKTGTVYEGMFSQNQFIQGNITYINGDEYNGTVKNGLRNDHQGRYAYKNFYGDESSEQCVKYVGGWEGDVKKDKSASVTYPKGETLKGAFQNGRFANKYECTYQWPDRTSFHGWIEEKSGQYIFKGTVTKPGGSGIYEV